MMSKQFRKKMALTLGACILSSTMTSPVIASPVNIPTQQSATTKNVSDWAESTVKQFMGTDYNGNYNYKFKATREEFAEVLEKAMTNLGYQFSEPTTNPFKDTNNKSVIKLTQAGLLSGTGKNVFSPNATLTREQMAVIICRVYDKLGVKLPTTKAFTIADVNTIAPYARQSVERLYRANIIVGDGNIYNPKAIVSREQAIIISARTEQTVKESQKTNDTTNNGNSQTGNDKVVDTQLYTYNPTLKTIVIKKDCILDANKSGTPTDFTKVTVNAGVEVTFKGIKIKDLASASESVVTLMSSTVENAILDTSKLVADKGSVVKVLYTYNSAIVDAEDTEINKVIIYKGDTDDDVVLDAIIKELSIEAPVEVTVDGEVTKAVIKKYDSILNIENKADDISVEADDCTVTLSNGAKVNRVTLGGETTLDVASGAKLKKLEVKDDGEDSVIKLKNSGDTDIKVSADCKINNKKIDKSDKVTYEDGKLSVNSSSSGGSSSSSGNEQDDEDMVDTAYEYLTYSNILGNNKDQYNVKSNLVLSSTVKDCSVKWYSSNEAVVSTTGVVTQLDTDTNVELRAKITKGSASTSRIFNVTVKAKEATDKPTDPTEALKIKLNADLAFVSLPSTIETPITVSKKSVSDFDLVYASNNPNLTVSESGSNFVLTPKQTDVDQSVSITVTIKSGTVSATKVLQTMIPKTSDEGDKGGDGDINQDRTALIANIKLKLNDVFGTVPLTLESGKTATVQKTVQPSIGETFPYDIKVTTSDPSVLEVSWGGTHHVLTAKSVTQPTKVTIYLTNEYDLVPTGDKWIGTEKLTNTVSREITITPQNTTPPTQVTIEQVKAEMNEKLATAPVPNSLGDIATVIRTFRSDLADIQPYTLDIKPVATSKLITVNYAGDNLELVPNNKLMSVPIEVPVTITLTGAFNGTPIVFSREHIISVVPLHDDEFWVNAIQNMIRTVKDEAVAKVPTTLTTTSSAIQLMNSYIIEDTDFYYATQVEFPEGENRITIDYYPNNTYTLTPNVTDGSRVDGKVNVMAQLGGTTYKLSTPVTFICGQGQQPPIGDEIWNTMLVTANIFEIINSIDVTLESTTDVGTVTIVVKDKHLDEELGRSDLTFLDKGGKFGNTVEVKTSKNAILGAYTYQIIQNGQVKKTGDLVNTTFKLNNTTSKLKDDTTLTFIPNN